jgi:hypothetical protein
VIPELWKSGRRVATAKKIVQHTLQSPKFRGLELFYLPQVTLDPPIVFAHLTGQALSKFLDQSELRQDEEVHEPLRYVHGRSEVMRGTPSVTAVVLAKAAGGPETEWRTSLPAIYSAFLSELDLSQK